jgi:hypothetical protein
MRVYTKKHRKSTRTPSSSSRDARLCARSWGLVAINYLHCPPYGCPGWTT